MSRDGSGVFSLQEANLPVRGQANNPEPVVNLFRELETDANVARPVSAGGTGATTAGGARLALGFPALAEGQVFTGAPGTGLVAGDVVTPTDTQTLTNKTLTSPAILGGLDLDGMTTDERVTLNGKLGHEVVVPEMFGITADDRLGATDITTKMNLMLAEGVDIVGQPGIYRVDGTLEVPSGMKLAGNRQRFFIHQYGQTLLNIANDAFDIEMSGISFKRLTTSPTINTTWMKAGAFQQCSFERFDFASYDDCLLMERFVTDPTSSPSTFNRFIDWRTNNIGMFMLTKGYDEWQLNHTWDGVETSVVWNKVFPANDRVTAGIKIMEADSNRVFRETQDWTVAFDGSGIPTITPTSTPAADTVWFITNTNPDSTNHRMFSNETFSGIKGNRCKIGAIQSLAWMDAQLFHDMRFIPGQDGAFGFRANCYDLSLRNHQAMDGTRIEDINFGLNPEALTDLATIRLMEFGPGCHGMQYEVLGDFGVVANGADNRTLLTYSGRDVQMTGTVSSNDTTTVTITGGDGDNEISLGGSSPDRLQILDRVFLISTRNSGTSFTVTRKVPTGVTGENIFRHNAQLENSFSAQFLGTIGDKVSNSAGRISEISQGVGTDRSGIATIPAGQRTVEVRVGSIRAPVETDEIILSEFADGDTQVARVTPGSFGFRSFQIEVPTAVVSDKRVRWKIKLNSLNADGQNIISSPNGGNPVWWLLGTGWTLDDGFINATAGSVANIEQQFERDDLETGDTVRLSYRVKNRTAGSVTPSLRDTLFGDTAVETGTARNTNDTFTEDFVLTGDINTLRFFKNGTFDGEIDRISLTLIAEA